MNLGKRVIIYRFITLSEGARTNLSIKKHGETLKKGGGGGGLDSGMDWGLQVLFLIS